MVRGCLVLSVSRVLVGVALAVSVSVLQSSFVLAEGCSDIVCTQEFACDENGEPLGFDLQPLRPEVGFCYYSKAVSCQRVLISSLQTQISESQGLRSEQEFRNLKKINRKLRKRIEALRAQR